MLLVTVYDQRVEKSTENLLESLCLDRLRFAGSIFAYRRMLVKNSGTARMKARKEEIRALKNTTPPEEASTELIVKPALGHPESPGRRIF